MVINNKRVSDRVKLVATKIIDYRWIIALLIFCVCVCLHLNGSSMSTISVYLPTVTDAYVDESYNIVGEARGVRSDEYAVHTPTYFSQEYNNYAKHSDRMGVGKTNMVLDYYAPTRDVTTIGKPFNWGYLMFGNEIGLSWYWCGLMIMLFMTAFEMFWILTKKDAVLSLAGMLLIGFSPAMQWWMIPHITIVFVYAMALFDIGYYFFFAKKKWIKWLVTGLAVIAIIGFALSIFPSCQLPCALVVCALLAGCFMRDKDEFIFDRYLAVRIAVVVLVVGAVLGEFLISSREDLKLLMNTAYPGQRVSTGGEITLYGLFTNLSSVYLSYKDSNVINNCEVAGFVHFAPLFLLLYPRINQRLRQDRDRQIFVGRSLFAALIIEIIFMCAGFPETLSKLTMFKFCNRMSICYGWTAAIFTLWCVYVIVNKKDIFRKWEMIAYPILYGAIYCTFIDATVLEYLPMKYQLLEIGCFVLILILAMTNHKRCFSCAMSVVMILAGFGVNPINRGISPITNRPISHYVSDTVKSDPDSKWLTVNTSSVVSNLIMANGARVLDATNFYPDNAKWEILDPDKEYEDCYNRYANMVFFFTDGEEYMENPTPDSINVYISPLELEKLGVKYLVSGGDSSSILDKYGIKYTVEFVQDNYFVYNIQY